jgi:hypothetical protein
MTVSNPRYTFTAALSGETMLLVRFVVGIIIAAAFSNSAEALDGNQLFKSCAQEEDTVSKAICIAYINGTVDGITLMSNDTGATKVFCAPPNTDGRQIQDVVKKFLTDNPVVRSSPASWSVARALHDAWPCREQP